MGEGVNRVSDYCRSASKKKRGGWGVKGYSITQKLLFVGLFALWHPLFFSNKKKKKKKKKVDVQTPLGCP